MQSRRAEMPLIVIWNFCRVSSPSSPISFSHSEYEASLELPAMEACMPECCQPRLKAAICLEFTWRRALQRLGAADDTESPILLCLLMLLLPAPFGFTDSARTLSI